MNRRFRRFDAALVAVLLLAARGAGASVAGAPAEVAPLEALIAAEFARHAGEGEAAAAWALAASRASDDPTIAALAVRTALQAGDTFRAAAALSRWTALDPRSASRDAYALRFHVVQGDDDQAVQAALRLLTRREGVADLVRGLEAPYPDGGVISRAVLRALRHEPAFPSNIDAWLAMAGLAQRLGDTTLSGQWIDALVERFPGDPRAGLLRAERLVQQGRREAARAEVRLVLARADLGAEPRRIAAEALAVLGDPAAAAEAMARGPQDARSLTLRAAWLARAGNLEALRALFAEAEALATPAAISREPALPLLLGELAERLQDWPAAERWYRRIERGEAGERARLRLGVVLARQGRFEEGLSALRSLQDDEAADGALRRDAFIAEADQFEARRDRIRAKAALDRGLGVLEDDPALRIARARLAQASGRSREAEADLRIVLDRDPGNAEALVALGALMLARGQPAAAEPLLARAFAAQASAPAAAAWGEALWMQGRTADAQGAWARGRALDPDDPVLLDTLQRYGQ